MTKLCQMANKAILALFLILPILTVATVIHFQPDELVRHGCN